MKLQDFRYYRAADVIKPQRMTLIVPTFTPSLPVWSGVSALLGEMALSNSYYFSFKTPIRSFGVGFVLAVRWTVDGNTRRLKLWADDDDVLYYPVYDGERIGLNAVLEIWSVNSDDVPTNAAAASMKISVLAFPTGSCCSCCSQPEASQTLEVIDSDPCPPYDYCSPWCND
jgi:hypothetical protein